MSTDNPYAFNPGSPFDVPVQGSSDAALNRIIQSLTQTRPWVRLMGVLTAIGAVLMGLGSCVTIPFLGRGRVGPFEIFFLMIYLGLAVLYGFAARFLLSYGTAISRAERTRSLDDVSEALVQQKSFWRLVGISTAIIITFYLAMLLLAIAVGSTFRGGFF